MEILMFIGDRLVPVIDPKHRRGRWENAAVQMLMDNTFKAKSVLLLSLTVTIKKKDNCSNFCRYIQSYVCK